MTFLQRLPITYKIVTVIMIISASTLLLASTSLIAYDFIAARRDLRSSTESVARIVADNMAAALSFNDQRAAQDTLLSLRAEPSIISACVYTPSRLFVERAPSGQSHCPELPGLRRQSGSDILVSMPIDLNGKRLGTVELLATLEPAYARLKLEIAALAGILLISTLFALALSSRLQKLISQPILSLAATANQVSRQNNHSLRAVKQSDDELGVLVDAFNQMLAQIEAREAELVQANRMKDEFLATLSHELRTPLTAIYGWIHMLRNTSMDPEHVAKALEVIDRNVRAQTQLVDDLLNVSRIITGNLKIEPEWMDPLLLTQTAVDSIRPSVDAKSLRLVVNLDPNTGLVFADPARWQQVLWNLLTNAVKFTPGGGAIAVTLERIGNRVQLVVKDSGDGIDAAFLPHVFDRFTQADSSKKRRYGGLGLGLAIVRHIVELHGGRISAQSEGLGLGSTFIVQLPIPSLPESDPRLRHVSRTGQHS